MLPTLPEGWEQRLVRLEFENGVMVRAHRGLSPRPVIVAAALQTLYNMISSTPASSARSRDDESGDAGVAAKGRTNMNAQTERTLIEKLNQLPPELIAEVDDFVDFLHSRNEQRQLVQAAMKASEPAFAAVWSNPDDSIYDAL
jgi:hypothetical protein